MKSLGIIRQIDRLGRVVVPKETRDILGLEEGSAIEFFSGENGEIILRPYAVTCVFCTETDQTKMIKFSGKLVCRECAKLMR